MGNIVVKDHCKLQVECIRYHSWLVSRHFSAANHGKIGVNFRRSPETIHKWCLKFSFFGLIPTFQMNPIKHIYILPLIRVHILFKWCLPLLLHLLRHLISSWLFSLYHSHTSLFLHKSLLSVKIILNVFLNASQPMF